MGRGRPMTLVSRCPTDWEIRRGRTPPRLICLSITRMNEVVTSTPGHFLISDGNGLETSYRGPEQGNPHLLHPAPKNGGRGLMGTTLSVSASSDMSYFMSSPATESSPATLGFPKEGL